MSDTKGNFTNIELTHQHTETAHSNAHGPSSGPWTNSTDAYSKKLNRTNSGAKRRTKDKSYWVFAILCPIVFVIGVALGIIIGRFAIQRPIQVTEDATEPAMSFKITQTSVSPTTASEINQCVCPTFPPLEVSTEKSTDECRKCPSRNPDLSSGDETRHSPFAPLTTEEIQLSIKALEFQGIIASRGNSLTQNRAAHVFLLPVEKSRALEYLDKNGTFPGRYAQVNVVRGAFTPPDIMEYKVGPLNETLSNITVEQLREDGEVHFNRRPYDMIEYFDIIGVVAKNIAYIKSLLSESFDGASFPRTVGIQFGQLPSVNENDRLSTAFLYLKMRGYLTIRILPVTCIVHHPGTNTSQWYASDFYYASQGPFTSWKEMQDRYNNGSVRKVKFPKSYYTEHYNEYDLSFNTSLPKRPLSNLPPPRTYEPEGPRYTIKGQQVHWMDWQLEFSSSPMHGPAIFDVKFKNKRIAYEISLQDITLIYSSQTNGAGPPVLSDTSFLLGSYNAPRLGLDCPERSSFLYASKFFYGSWKSMKAACVFEADGQKPLWRFGSRGLADHHLIIRASMNLGNYDYTLEWKFYLGGNLETLLSASGYLYGAFWDPDDPYLNGEKSATPFGYRISDFQIGPIHNHNYVFKVDLDILGTNNSFQTVNWRAGSTLEAFQTRANISVKPGYFYFNNTRYLRQEFLQNEDSFISNPLKPKYFTVVNENERNYWGNIRGYRIIPYSKATEVLEEHIMLNVWDDLKYMVAVTKQRDSEKYGTTSWYDLTHPNQAFKGIGRFLDNETVRHEDLVLWISEKFFHAPSSEDLPMTLSVPNGFMLKPYNYFDRSPVFDVQAHYSKYKNPYLIPKCYENFK
ncbi:membrane primary amine oxidase-like [Mercenaria mercenaria]|uniref:membrane primary amine oxidase-like n=1 Tax=Mercenaria mercenaria TaxID=6596 RepID=UPI00234F3E8E|nr:membrane primary amine oxidase-like [Mercenaria mercenaria]